NAATVEKVITQAKASKSSTPYLDALSAAHDAYHRKNKAPATAPTASASRPVIHRATATAKKPTMAAPAAPSATITASEFATAEKSMTLPEFRKLNPSDQMRFAKSGGKIV